MKQEELLMLKNMIFMLDNAYEDGTLEELTAALIMMARIQPADEKDDVESKYDAEAIGKVNASQIYLISGMLSKGVHEHTYHEKLKTIINTSVDDQINANIIFNDPYVENNGEIDKDDSNAHDQSFDIESLVLDNHEHNGLLHCSCSTEHLSFWI
nr:hypothetical protein [Tanacetum cinerariifolium]